MGWLLSLEYALVIFDDAAQVIFLVDCRLDDHRLVIDIYFSGLLNRPLIVINFMLRIVEAARVPQWCQGLRSLILICLNLHGRGSTLAKHKVKRDLL